MGNSLGSKDKRTTKVMKITGETIKLQTPVKAEDVVKDYPRHVLLESEAVKHFGIRAKPLQPQQNLEPKRLYFLVELPDVATEEIVVPRRVRSAINMSAKDRLENLMLSRRSASDLSIMKPVIRSGSSEEGEGGGGGGAVRLKMKLPRAEVEKLMKESETDDEFVQKMRDLCMANREKQQQQQQQMNLNNNHNRNGNGDGNERFKARAKRVSFMPINEGGSQITVAS